MTVPEAKKELLVSAEATISKITAQYRRGLVTDEERYKAVIETWKQTDEQLTKALLDGLDKYNNIYMMADSGARGSNQQIKQLLTYWSTSFLPMVPERVCPIQLSVQPIQVT